MNVQELLLQKFGEQLVGKYRASIADTRTSGETERSIHAVVTGMSLSILANKSIGALEYGRQPSNSGSKPGTLYDVILKWVQTKGITFQDDIIKSKYSIQERTAKTITYFIHKRGTKLFSTGKDFHGKGKGERLTEVTDKINMDILLKDLTAIQIGEYSSEVIKSLKQLQ